MIPPEAARLSVLAALLLSGCTRVIVVRECQTPEPPRVTENVVPHFKTTMEAHPEDERWCAKADACFPLGEKIAISTAALRSLSTGYHINGVSW